MAIQYLETNVIGAYLVDAWQNNLQTESDPTSGKWFRQGPGNSGGLFGGLTDILVTDLTYDPSVSTVNKTKDVALSTTLDNRSGLLTDSQSTNTLTWQVTNTVTTSQSKTNSIKSSITEKITAKGKIGVVEISSETTIGFEYAYSWSTSEAVTQTDTKSYTSSVTLKVPKGKVYKLVVLADKNSLTIPYHAKIRLRGTSEANFDHPINGKTQWQADAGTICAWIKKYNSAKGDDMEFDADPALPSEGIASIRGTMRVDNAVNFTIFAIDVTSSYVADPNSSAAIKKLLQGEPAGAEPVTALGSVPVAA